MVKYNDSETLLARMRTPSEALPRLYLVSSKEEYGRKEAVNAIKEGLQQAFQEETLTVKRISQDKFQIDQLLEELSSLLLFTKQQLIIIDDADAINKNALECLYPFLDKPTKETFLIFSASAIKKNSTFYKKLEKSGAIVELPELKPWEQERALAPWIASYIKSSGKKIGVKESALLIQRLGTDKQLLTQEIDKLCCYIGEKKEIAQEDILAITTKNSSEDNWKFGEAIFARNGKEAVRISHSLIEEGAALIMLLRQLRSQFQTHARIASMLSCEATPAQITEIFPYMRGRLLERNIQSARQYGLKQLQEGLVAIDEVELAAKSYSHNLSPLLLIETLIAKLTS